MDDYYFVEALAQRIMSGEQLMAMGCAGAADMSWAILGHPGFLAFQYLSSTGFPGSWPWVRAYSSVLGAMLDRDYVELTGRNSACHSSDR